MAFCAVEDFFLRRTTLAYARMALGAAPFFINKGE